MKQRLPLAALNEIRECTGHTLRKTTRAVSQRFDAKLRKTGLRLTQYAMLNTLALLEAKTTEPVTITIFADHLLVNRTTLARTLRPLERDGLVHVAPGEDRRTRHVRLTDAGHAKLAEGYARWQQAQAEVVDALGRDRWNRLQDDLSALATLMQ